MPLQGPARQLLCDVVAGDAWLQNPLLHLQVFLDSSSLRSLQSFVVPCPAEKAMYQGRGLKCVWRQGVLHPSNFFVAVPHPLFRHAQSHTS